MNLLRNKEVGNMPDNVYEYIVTCLEEYEVVEMITGLLKLYKEFNNAEAGLMASELMKAFLIYYE